MTQEQIKDEYAISKGYFSWENLFRSYKTNCSTNDFYHCINMHENEVMKIYARECLKLASDNVDYKIGSVIYRYVTESITNENNIIK